jgi:hypothetical protein
MSSIDGNVRLWALKVIGRETPGVEIVYESLPETQDLFLFKTPFLVVLGMIWENIPWFIRFA